MRQLNPFEVLGVSAEAEREVIRAAYRALAKKYHPDVQRGMDPRGSSQRMAELNWAFEELERDLAGWRLRAAGARVSSGQAAGRDATREQPPRTEERDFDSWWNNHVEQYRRPKGQPLGWREWIGSDVVCEECGCVLSTYVYKCPDCGKEGTWKRSTLHTVGHKLRVVYYVLLYVFGFGIAVPVLLALLAIPPILVLDLTGIGGSGAPWDWDVEAQILLALGMALELGVWAAWSNWERLSQAARKYWEG